MQRHDMSQWRSSEVARLLALVENERRYYQDLFAMLPVAVAVVGAGQSLLWINREFRIRFELVHEDLSQVRVADLIPDPKLEQALAELLAGEKREASIEARAGIRTLRLNLKRTNGWLDSPEPEVLMTVDTAEGEAAEAGLPNAAGTVRWSLDRESGQYFAVSPSAETTFGLPPDAWQTLRGWAESRVHAGDREMFLEFYGRQDDEWDGVIDYRMAGPAGEVRLCRDRVSATVDEIHGWTQDRTGEARAARKASLQARVKAAEKLSARVAHVANNLLMIVGGYSGEIIESLPENDPRRGDLQEVVNAAGRLSRLTAQLNPMPAQAGAGEFEIHGWAGRQTPPVEVEGTAAKVLCPQSELTGLVTAVRQIWPDVDVRAETWPDLGEAEVWFSFAGKSEDEVEDLLDPFAGPKVGSDPPFGPLRHIGHVLAAGGSAWVEPTMDGARLVVSLPAEEIEAQPEAAVPAKGTVLLVEDEDGLRTLMAKSLRRAEYAVIEAASAEAALDALTTPGAAVDICVTDLSLPGMGGGKLALEVRNLHAEVPVVFITGASEDAEAAAMLRSGSRATLLRKPFPVEELVREVNTVLSGRMSRGASAGQ